MPKSRNLPMTTREPKSDGKAREFLLPSSSWGSQPYRRSSYREEPWALGYIAYIGYYRVKNSKNGSLRVWLVTFWWRVRCWVLIGSPFPGLTWISRAGQGFWLVPRWWGEVRGFPKALFSEPYKMEWLWFFIPPFSRIQDRPNHGSEVSSILSPAKGTVGRAAYWDLSTMSCIVLMQFLMKATS